MSQSDILALAKQGHPQAIAIIINRSPHFQSITVKVVRQEHLLHILLEAEQLPEQGLVLDHITQILTKLQIEPTPAVQVYARRQGESAAVWADVIQLEKPEPSLSPTLEEETPDPSLRIVSEPIAEVDEQPDHGSELNQSESTPLLNDTEATSEMASESIFPEDVATPNLPSGEPDPDQSEQSGSNPTEPTNAGWIAAEALLVVEEQAEIALEEPDQLPARSADVEAAPPDLEEPLTSPGDRVSEPDDQLEELSDAIEALLDQDSPVSPENSDLPALTPEDVEEADAVMVSGTLGYADAALVEDPEMPGEAALVSEILDDAQIVAETPAPEVAIEPEASPDEGPGELVNSQTTDLDFSQLTPQELLKRPEAVAFIFLIAFLALWQAFWLILQDSEPLDISLSGRGLARRLGVSASTVSRRRDREDFAEWTQSLDPEGLAWAMRADGRFVPQLTEANLAEPLSASETVVEISE